MINKGIRQQRKINHYKKRLKNLCLKESDDNAERGYSAYRSHGAPCSCWACRQKKYRDNRGKNNSFNLNEE